MPVKFCAHARCNKVAVRMGRSAECCRAHYASDVLAGVTLTRARVCGPAQIVDARTDEAVDPGGVVELDPEVTAVPALVYAGLVEVLDDGPDAAEG